MRKEVLSTWTWQICALSILVYIFFFFFVHPEVSFLPSVQKELRPGETTEVCSFLPLYIWQTWSYPNTEEGNINSSHRSISFHGRKEILTIPWQKRIAFTLKKCATLIIKNKSSSSGFFYTNLILQIFLQFWRIVFSVRVPEMTSEYFQEILSVKRQVHNSWLPKAKQIWLKVLSSKQIAEELYCMRYYSWWRILWYLWCTLVLLQYKEKMRLLTLPLLKSPSTLSYPPFFCLIPIDYLYTKVQLIIFISSEKGGSVKRFKTTWVPIARVSVWMSPAVIKTQAMKFLRVAHHDSICQHFKQKQTG